MTKEAMIIAAKAYLALRTPWTWEKVPHALDYSATELLTPFALEQIAARDKEWLAAIEKVEGVSSSHIHYGLGQNLNLDARMKGYQAALDAVRREMENRLTPLPQNN